MYGVYASTMKPPTLESSSMAAGIAAALGASSCCLAPLALVSAGLGGAWIAQVRALERFSGAFIVAGLASFVFAFYRLYLRRAPCDSGAACGNPRILRRQRIAFWLTLIVAHALALSPYYASLLLR